MNKEEKLDKVLSTATEAISALVSAVALEERFKIVKELGEDVEKGTPEAKLRFLAARSRWEKINLYNHGTPS